MKYLLFLTLLFSFSVKSQTQSLPPKDSSKPVFTLTDTTKIFFDLTYEHFRYLIESLDKSAYRHDKVMEIISAYNTSIQKFLQSKYVPPKEAKK